MNAYIHKGFVIGSLTFLYLSASFTAPAQTIEELRKENAELKEKLRLIKENNDLKVQIEAAKNSPAPVSQGNGSAGNSLNVAKPPQNSANPVPASSSLPSVANNPSIPDLNQTVTAATNDSKCNPAVKKQTEFNRNLCELTDQFRDNNELRAGTKNLAVLFMYFAQTDQNIKNFIGKFEDTRTDKQIGGDSTGRGTTSLIVKGSAPKIIGWAIENGAATSSISGTRVTIRINPTGLLDALAAQSVQLPFNTSFAGTRNNYRFSVTDADDSFTRFAKKASFGLTFDTARGTDPPTFIGSKQQLAAMSFRYEFINRRNPLRSEFDSEWNDFFRTEANTILTNQADAVSKLITGQEIFKNALLQQWATETETALLAIPADADGKRDFTKIREKLEERLGVLPTAEILKDADVKQALTSLAEAGAKFTEARKDFLNRINKGTIITFEYTNNREINAPDTSNFNFIAEVGRTFGSGVMDMTFNSSVTTYNKIPIGATVKRIRDFNFGMQVDFPFSYAILDDAVLSFAGKYIRLNSDIFNELGLVIPNTKGDIAVGQLKLTIPIPRWGVRLPLSMTVANRTDLIKESIVRGNFGITFDLDSMFGRKRIF